MNMPAPAEEAVATARRVIETEAAAITALGDRLGDGFAAAVDLIAGMSGSVIVTGIGKSGLVGAKLAGTLASFDVPAHFVHATEALHGDAGRLRDGDVLVALSNSGSTPEVCAFARLAADRGCPIVAVVGRVDSELASLATAVLDVSVEREADPLNLAPTASTAAAMAMGDAVAAAVMARMGTTERDFHRNHPAGALGNLLERGRGAS